MKNKILTFIIGVLVGAIITTVGFLIYNKATINNNSNQPEMMQTNGNMGQPPEKPDGDNGEEPPARPEDSNTKTNTNSNT